MKIKKSYFWDYFEKNLKIFYILNESSSLISNIQTAPKFIACFTYYHNCQNSTNLFTWLLICNRWY